jgi:hypothetical protein
MSAFVVVMWEVFEDFVTVALKEALADCPGYVESQLAAYLTGDGDWTTGWTGGRDDSHGDVFMRVDVVHRDEAGDPDVIFDAKYKLASNTGRNANADHYQMLAYCTSLQVPVGWLIYAGGGKSRTQRSRWLRRPSTCANRHKRSWRVSDRSLSAPSARNRRVPAVRQRHRTVGTRFRGVRVLSTPGR